MLTLQPRNEPLLQVDCFTLSLMTPKVELLRELNFSLYSKEIVGIVGESGCGKSLTVQSILKILPSRFHMNGAIKFKNSNLLDLSEKAMREVRGSQIGLISQNPSTALNPTLKIQTQLIETLLKVQPYLKKREAIEIGITWLERMQVTYPALRMQQYPHELSGGMKQRVALAMALMCKPALLLADEPTTALDMTVQAEILLLFKELVAEQELSLLLITHDLGVVANCCDRVLVMHAGQIVDSGSVDAIFFTSKNPYTQSLLQAKQQLIYDVQ